MENSPPLQDLTFLNTRDIRSAPKLTDMLTENGARVVGCPTIQFIPPSNWASFDRRLERISPDDWIVFTSATAVQAALDRLWELNHPPAVLARGNIAAIGQGTANALRNHKLKVDLMPGVAQQEALLEVLLKELRRINKVWIPRAQDARELLVNGLREQGFEVLVTPVYQTVPGGPMPREAREALLQGGIDWILFSSSSTVKNFVQMLDEKTAAHLSLHWPRIGCIGAVTADAARDYGLPVQVVPARQDMEGLVSAVIHDVLGGGPPPEPE